MSPSIFSLWIDGVKKGIIRVRGNRSETFREKGKWRYLTLVYEDDLVLCSESEEGFRVTIGHFLKVCERMCKD